MSNELKNGKIDSSNDFEKKTITDFKDTKPKEDRYIKDSLVFLGLGMQIFASTVIGVYIGKYIDEYLGASSYMIVLCGFAGLVIGFYTFFKMAKRRNKNNDDTD